MSSPAINQFKMSAIKGMLDLRFNPNTISCRVDPAMSGTLTAGQFVKRVDSLSSVPLVTAVTAATDDVFGAVNFSMKDAAFIPGQHLEISAFRGNILYCNATAAVAAGAKLQLDLADLTSVKTAVAGSSGTIIGRAYDKIGAAGLIRVELDLPGTPA